MESDTFELDKVTFFSVLLLLELCLSLVCVFRAWKVLNIILYFFTHNFHLNYNSQGAHHMDQQVFIQHWLDVILVLGQAVGK